MNEEQESFIRQVEQVGKGKVLIKVTGREAVDLAPHSHHCIQVVGDYCRLSSCDGRGS